MSRIVHTDIWSAYGYAKKAGYTGTVEEFEAGLKKSAEADDHAAASAAAAAESETNAAASASAAATSAENAALFESNAQGYASAAAGAASDAQGYAATATTKATQAGESAGAAESSASTASTKASEASASATNAAASATAAGSSATAAAGSASAAATSETNAAASATSASGSATAAANNAAAAQAAADEAEEVLESIPEDYSELSADVDAIKKADAIKFSSTWEFGTFNDSTGDEKVSTTRIRTVDFFAVAVGETAVITPPPGCNIDFYTWESGTYTGHHGWTSNVITVSPAVATSYKFIINKPSGTLSPSDGDNANIVKKYPLLDKIEDIEDTVAIASPYAVYRPQVNILDGQHIMAHKGGNFGAPLNTMPAFLEGYKKGFCVIECDVQVTSDDIVVVCHDRSINGVARNSDGTAISATINVDEHTYSELLTYDFGIAYGSEYAGTKIVKLEDFLLFCKRNNIMGYIDTDSTYDMINNVPLIYNTVRNLHMQKNVFFDCQTYAVIDAFTALDTKLNIVGQRADSESTIARYEARVGNCNVLIASCGQSYYDPTTWTKEYVSSLHAKGLLAKVTLPSATKQNVLDIFATGTDFVMVDTLTPYTLYDY